MSSILTIKITTDGDYVIKNPIQFTPSMIRESGYIIYFPPTIKLSNKLFNDILPEEEIISILTSRTLFTKFLNKIIKKKDFKKITLKEADEKGIVKHNMNFYKDLFFNKRKFYFNGVAFTIRKSNMINYSAPTKLPTTVPAYLNYELVVNLSLIKTSRATRVNMMRENCKDKAKRINDLSKELFGKSLGLYKEEDSELNLRELLPAMFSSPETGYTTENIPRQQQYPRQQYRLPYPPQQYLPQQYGLPYPSQQYPPQQYRLPYPQQQYPPQPYGLPYPPQQYQIPYRSDRERALLNRRTRRGGKNKKHIKTRKIRY